MLLASCALCLAPAGVSAQACAAPIEGDLGCLGTAAGRVEYADGNDVTGTCGGGVRLGSPDNVFTFTCSGAGTVDLAMTAMHCDLDLFVLGPGDCAGSGSCYARPTNGLTPLSAGAMIVAEALSFECTPNETYYVVVDAFGQTGETDCEACSFACVIAGCGAAYPPTSNVGVINCDGAAMEGDYTLNVTGGGGLGCGEQCTDGTDNDGDGAVDRADGDCAGAAACATCSGGCFIDGVCHVDGVANPSVACEVCDVSFSATAWTRASDGTVCGAASGACDGPDVCVAGTCVAGSPVSCDDGDACTGDSCSEPSGCDHAAIAGCCNLAADCNDADVCKADSCAGPGGSCVHGAITGCCTEDSGCSDGVSCTDDSCDLSTNRCAFAPITGCCSGAADCDDSNVCTVDSCEASTGTCINALSAGCCLVDRVTCVSAPMAGCCAAPAGSDASAAPDGGIGPVAEDGGCRCRSTGAGDAGDGAWPLALTAAWLFWRRRRCVRR